MRKRSQPSLQFDEIGYWSEVKLDIVKEYATAYSQILSAQTRPKLYHSYIDAFAGAGIHLSKTSGQLIAGSPINALYVNPPFREFHLIDLDGQKVERLKQVIGQRTNVNIYKGDAIRFYLTRYFRRLDTRITGEVYVY